MKVLIIDNNIDPEWWGSKDLCRLAKLAPGANVYVRRAPQEDLPPSPQGFDRIIVSGSKTSAFEDSPWIDHLIHFVKRTLDQRIPYLGVCYGHQILARTLGGKEVLGTASQAEFGWTSIEVTQTSLIFKGLPSQFYSFSAHFEEVSKLPKNVISFAKSDHCPIQAIQIDGSPAFGIQFHPEKSIEEAKKILIERKKTKNPPNLLHPDQSDKFFNPNLGEMIFKNFLELGN